MESFTTLSSQVIPLNMRDIDTDMIIPASYLTSIDRDGYGQNVFRRLRDSDPNFPFNQDQYKNAQILLADDNFGCGSSREHAVWALQGWGIKAVLSKSFADIFAGNSAKNGLLTITLPAEIIEQLLKQAKNEKLVITIDLPNQEVKLPDNQIIKFDFDPFRKHCIINGLDDLDYLLSHQADIKEFKTTKIKKFFSSLTANN
jgi:3-isopropylmalate/(R)-2-methylmalate dehydratase small subunit